MEFRVCARKMMSINRRKLEIIRNVVRCCVGITGLTYYSSEWVNNWFKYSPSKKLYEQFELVVITIIPSTLVCYILCCYVSFCVAKLDKMIRFK